MEEYPVVLFDGICNFCNSTVQFIIKRDPKHHFRFAALQSEAGEKLLSDKGSPVNSSDPDSIVLVENGKIYLRSSAALRISRKLSGLWPMMYYIFIIIPAPLRDIVYKFIARNRYRWFGRRESCMIPSPEQRQLFID